MSKMVERVAKAICDGKWDAADFTETANGEEPEEQREYWRSIARAAIEAMREPTPIQCVAGALAVDIRPSEAGAVFVAMIDAALSGDA